MKDELNKQNVKQDLEEWGNIIRLSILDNNEGRRIELDKKLRELYQKMNEIYILLNEKEEFNNELEENR